MSANQQRIQQELSDKEFLKIHAKQFTELVPILKESNNNGKFTDVNIEMNRNNGIEHLQ